MKVKVKEILERKTSIAKKKAMLDSLKLCYDKFFDELHISAPDVDAVEATLEEYEEILDAILDSAEVDI